MKIKNKHEHYQRRIKNRKHLREIAFKFSGDWDEIKKIIKIFGDFTAQYQDEDDAARYYPILNCGAKVAAADFKYCYESFLKESDRIFNKDESLDMHLFFEKKKINEFYRCVDRNPNLSYIYNLPTDIVYDKNISAGAFRVLCAFRARAKFYPKKKVRLCGWSAEKLSGLLGLHRNTISSHINELVQNKYLKLYKRESNKRKKVYRVKI